MGVDLRVGDAGSSMPGIASSALALECRCSHLDSSSSSNSSSLASLALPRRASRSAAAAPARLRARRLPLSWIASACALVLGGGCAPLPSSLPERGLYRDLDKLVELRESDAWIADRFEIEAALPHAMRSVCEVPSPARARLLDWLSAQIGAQGGPSDRLHAREGSSQRVRRVRRLERIHRLLVRADEAALECPTWLAPDPSFAGREGDEGRFVILAETLGAGALLLGAEGVAVGGGGGGRLLPAFGLGPRLTLALGLELGGTASFIGEVRGAFAGAIPLLLRIHQTSRVLDVELALTAGWVGGALRTPGVRVGLGYGLSTLRVSSFMPYGLIWIGYELRPATTGAAFEQVVWLGTRVGFDWDP
ncbi:MAG: hypothetical protein OEY14_01730 [Myxococcales bacterium]|nr:hypothetical protein [Myxococcales bacterium]